MDTFPPSQSVGRRSLTRRVLSSTAIAALIGGLALTTFEILYRMQVVDTYAPELNAYNPTD